MRASVAACIVVTSLQFGCNRPATRESLDAGSPKPDPAKLARYREAEFSRNASKIALTDLTGRVVSERRAAVRALSRIQDPLSRDLLLHALHDEDREVVAWAVFGLGQKCSGPVARETALALVARAGTLFLNKERAPSALDPFYATATALGRCATDEAEATLRSWLTVDEEMARHAALGLSVYAATRKRLDTVTLVAMLDAADKYRGFAVGVLPLSRLDELDSAVGDRLLTLAPRLLETSGEERRFVIRALVHAGTPALAMLSRIVTDDSQYRPAERAEALRVIGKLGERGQDLLGQLLQRVVRADKTPDEVWLLGADYSVLMELLSQLRSVDSKSRDYLAKVAKLPNPQPASKATTLRLDRLRCQAASLAVADELASPLLETCAGTEGSRDQKLAYLRVLGHHRLRGKLLTRLDSLLADSDPIVRIEVYKLLLAHDEIRERADRFALALSDKSNGVVATVAEILSKRPELALKGERPHRELIETLERVARSPHPIDATELVASLIDAIGALGVLSAKPWVSDACSSLTPRIRERAEFALRRLGEPKRDCAAPTQKSQAPMRPIRDEGEVTLRFLTELGALELRLFPKSAPLACERVITLAQSGFYDGMPIHRVVPGFVVQLGDKSGDGYGGSGMPPLPDELSPISFSTGDVGMALSGSDSGSSQFFVTLGPYPQLAGDYTRVGRAGLGWDKLTVGDVIQKVELSP